MKDNFAINGVNPKKAEVIAAIEKHFAAEELDSTME